jgi:hypothetical protein
MPQIFKPSANSIAKVSLLGVALLPWVVGGGLVLAGRSPMNTRVNVAITQPIPFSHRHHALELGIDCRYCHVSVEKSRSAGIPATETCMSCHSQIWTNSPLLEPVRQSYETNTPIVWTQVNKVPDFVYFSHDIHVARGISCNQCHGAVQDMDLTWKGRALSMAWCLECHRAPEKYLYQDPAATSPRQQVFDLYWKLQSNAELSPRERSLARGGEQFSASAADAAEGRRLINEYGVQVQQLADCWICHR